MKNHWPKRRERREFDSRPTSGVSRCNATRLSGVRPFNPLCRTTRIVAFVAVQATSRGRCGRPKEQKNQWFTAISVELRRTRFQQCIQPVKITVRATSERRSRSMRSMPRPRKSPALRVLHIGELIGICCNDRPPLLARASRLVAGALASSVYSKSIGRGGAVRILSAPWTDRRRAG